MFHPQSKNGNISKAISSHLLQRHDNHVREITADAAVHTPVQNKNSRQAIADWLYRHNHRKKADMKRSPV